MAINGKKLKKFVIKAYSKGKKAYSEYKKGAPEREEKKFKALQEKMKKLEQKEVMTLERLERQKEMQNLKSEIRETRMKPFKEKFAKLKGAVQEKLPQDVSEEGDESPPSMEKPKQTLPTPPNKELLGSQWWSKEATPGTDSYAKVNGTDTLGLGFEPGGRQTPSKDPLGFGFETSRQSSDPLGLKLERREFRNVRRAEKKYAKRTRRPAMSMDEFLGLK